MPMPVAASTFDQHQAPRRTFSPIVVAIAGWLLPGAGYWLIGERARGMVVGITIIILFTAGTLIGGVRAIQVPGYSEGGDHLYTWYQTKPAGTGRTIVSETKPGKGFGESEKGDWVVTDFRALLGEIGNKPWSICQVLAGPIAIVGGATSVWASRVDAPATIARGALSHSRINEIAVLYTAVAGMLNLLAMIDAAGRADDALAASSGQRSGAFNVFLGLVRGALKGMRR